MSNKKSEYETVIDSSPTFFGYIKDLYQFRELFYCFAWRDFLVRFKQTFLGAAWAIIKPLLNMIVFTFVFGRIAHLDSSGINYSLFVLAGLLPWQLFSNSIVDASQSLISNSSVISKIYFPRFLLILSNISINLIDFFIGLGAVLLLFIVTGSLNITTIFFMPLLIILTLFFCLGVSLWLSAINVRYRDIRFLMPFIVQFGMFVSPVGYGSFLVPERWRWVYYLNPMAGIIDGFRWCCFGIGHSELHLSLSLSIVMTTFILVTGFRYFRKMEMVFADII